MRIPYPAFLQTDGDGACPCATVYLEINYFQQTPKRVQRSCPVVSAPVEYAAVQRRSSCRYSHHKDTANIAHRRTAVIHSWLAVLPKTVFLLVCR